MVANLKPSEQLHFVGLLCCMGNGDGEGAAEHVLNFSAMQTCTTPTAVAAFKQEMIHFFAEHCRGYNTGIDLAEVLRGVLSLVRFLLPFLHKCAVYKYRYSIASCVHPCFEPLHFGTHSHTFFTHCVPEPCGL